MVVTTRQRIVLPALLALALGLAACGGDDESSSSGSATEPPETRTTETAPADPAADAEQEEETQALGTMQAFVDAAEQSDETVFCGIVSEEFLSQLSKGLTVAQCLEALEGVEFKALRRLRGATADSVEVDGDVAAGQLKLRDGETTVGVILRKPEDRWLVHRFAKA